MSAHDPRGAGHSVTPSPRHPLTPTPAEVQAAVAKLHADYCALTGRVTPLQFSQRLWWDLLQSAEYAYDAARMWADVQHLVRYLQLGIRDGKRNLGALKLMNLLQPDRYWEDLAEARATLRPARAPKAVPHVPAPGEERAPAELADRGAEELRKWREQRR